jgi:hypothetical protein
MILESYKMMIFPLLMIFISEINTEITKGKLDLAFCDNWIKSHVFNSTEMHHINQTFPMIMFQNQSELNAIQNARCPILGYVEQMKLFSIEQIVLDSDLDLRSVRKLFKFYKLPVIVIENLRGFNQNLNGTKLYENNFFLFLNDIRFEFHLKGKILSDNECVRSYFEYGNIFGSLKLLLFAIHEKYVHTIL